MNDDQRTTRKTWHCAVLLLWLAASTAPAAETRRYPAHWGPPPPDQKADIVDLPLGYGKGGTNLAAWILSNLEKDTAPTNMTAQVLFSCDFEKAETNKVPEEFLVLDGAFAVKAESGNKFFELPGAPLDSYGAMFGPTVSNNVAVSARVLGTNKGKRGPVFGVGLGGAGGLKLLVAPGKRVVELVRGDESLASAPFKWEAGGWTCLRLQLRRIGEKEWQLEGKAWKEGAPEPANWQVIRRDTADLTPGRSTLWGSPISGMPIRFDDLKVTTVGRVP